MPCPKCGARTHRNKGYCSTVCRLSDREDPDHKWYSCPDCGGITSSQDTLCATCRAETKEEGTT